MSALCSVCRGETDDCNPGCNIKPYLFYLEILYRILGFGISELLFVPLWLLFSVVVELVKLNSMQRKRQVFRLAVKDTEECCIEVTHD